MFMRKAFVLFAELESEAARLDGTTAPGDWIIDWRWLAAEQEEAKSPQTPFARERALIH